VARKGKTKIIHKNVIRNHLLKDQEGERRMTLRWILEKQVARMGGGWN